MCAFEQRGKILDTISGWTLHDSTNHVIMLMFTHHVEHYFMLTLWPCKYAVLLEEGPFQTTRDSPPFIAVFAVPNVNFVPSYKKKCIPYIRKILVIKKIVIGNGEVQYDYRGLHIST